MSFQWALLVLLVGLYAGWCAVKGLRSGSVMPYFRGANRDWTFLRSDNPAGFWAVVSWYFIVLGTGVAAMVIYCTGR